MMEKTGVTQKVSTKNLTTSPMAEPLLHQVLNHLYYVVSVVSKVSKSPISCCGGSSYV